MKTQNILRKAAQLVDSGEEEFSCLAICAAGGFSTLGDPSPAEAFYSDLLTHQGHTICANEFHPLGMPREEAQNHRVIALLMAAEIAKDER